MSAYILKDSENFTIIFQVYTPVGWLVVGVTTRSIVVIWVKHVQTELMSEIYSKSPVRAIGKVLLMKFSSNAN